VNYVAEQEEESETTLEEEVQLLQEQKVPPEKIVEKILEEDLNADIGKLSELLGMDKMDIGRIKGRISRKQKRLLIKTGGEKSSTVEEVAGEGSLYKGEPDANVILRKVLSSHPDMPSKVIAEILSWAEYGPISPQQLAYLLQNLKGISNQTANIIAQKYMLALQKAQQEGRIQQPPLFIVTPPLGGQGGGLLGFPVAGQQQQPGPGQPGTGQPGQTWPSGGQQGGYGNSPMSLQDIRVAIREEIRYLEERRPQDRANEAFVEIDEPLRAEDGRILIGDDEKPIMRHLRVPASQAERIVGSQHEDSETKILTKMRLYKDLFKTDVTEEKIRAIVREETPPPAPQEKPITREDLTAATAKAADEAAKQVLSAKEKEDKLERRFAEVKEEIHRVGSAHVADGYQQDGARILGQGMGEVAEIVRERHPIEVIIREGGPLIFGGTPAKQVEAGAEGGLISRLKNRDWVTQS